jgi:beta-mannosidase
MAKPLTSQVLTTGWSFKQTDDDSEAAWMPVARVPTNVHLDLMDNKK